MTEAEWLTCDDPGPVLRLLLDRRPRPGGVTARKFRLFAAGLCRLYWDELGGERNRRAVEVAERYADGLVGEHELAAHGGSGFQEDSYIAENYTAAPASACEADADAAAREVLNLCSPPDFSFVRELSTAEWRRVQEQWRAHLGVLRDVFGNPFRPVSFSPDWRTATAVALARQMYESGEFSAMPILADALQDAGCDDENVLSHCPTCRASPSSRLRGTAGRTVSRSSPTLPGQAEVDRPPR